MINKSRSQTIDFSGWKASQSTILPKKRRSIAFQSLQLPHLPAPTPPITDKLKTPLKPVQDHTAQKRKFTQSIRRFQYLTSQPNIDVEEIGRAGLNVLDGFGTVENNFTDLFIQLAKRMKSFCLYDMDYDYELHKELRTIEDMGGMLRNGLSLRNIVMGMKTCYHTLESRKDQIIQTHKTHIKELEEVIQGKNNLIGRLKERVQYYASDPTRNIRDEYQDLVVKHKQMEEQLGDLYEKRENLSSQVEIREKQRDFYKKEVVIVRDVIQKLRQKVRVLEENPHKYHEVLAKVQQYKDMLDKIFVKVQSLAGEIHAIKKQNEELVSERTSMLHRAAVQFDELTPRPNYQKAIGRKLAFDSTQNIFDKLMGKANLDDATTKEVFVKKSKNKGKKAQKLRQEILADVTDAKKDLDKFGIQE